MKGILGTKVGMTQVWRGERLVPVTVVLAGPCPVVQRKNATSDGYDAVQLGWHETSGKAANKPKLGHFKKHGVAPQRHLVEFRDYAPDGDAVTIAIDSIYQDEPVNADDDGNTMPDAFLGLGNDFEIRAERDGEGNGRVYHVSFTASDATASCVGTVQIAVNLNEGRNGAAIDDGPLYDATAN